MNKKLRKQSTEITSRIVQYIQCIQSDQIEIQASFTPLPEFLLFRLLYIHYQIYILIITEPWMCCHNSTKLLSIRHKYINSNNNIQ